MFFSFKTVKQLQVIYHPLFRQKQTRAEAYAVGRKIGLDRVNLALYCISQNKKNNEINNDFT
jgi:hypothetical protein